jgi:DNA repair protein RecN (Recombination protein N)
VLRSLRIRDYALIEELSIDFDSGLNIVTGQTGAGKSILVGAMEMIIGERASTEVVRSGATKAVVEGVFEGADISPVEELLEENAIEPAADGELIMRREIRSQQSRAFINDTPGTVHLMREIAGYLIDLHGQHEHQSLLRTEEHLRMLDDYGGLGGLVERYRENYERVRGLVEDRTDLLDREKELEQKKELVAFQIEEIDRIDPQPGEEADLEAEMRVLANAEQLYESTNRLYRLLFESDHSVYDRLVVARNELQDLQRIDAEFEEISEEIESAEIIVSEVTKFLQDYNAQIEFDPERLEEIRQRLNELDTLKRKYGGSVEAVLEHREEIGEVHALAENYEAEIGQLNEEIEEARQELSRTAHRLSRKRKEVAKTVEEGVIRELKTLGIKHAEFEIHFDRQFDESGWVSLPPDSSASDRYQAFTHGVDEVEFYISTNVGEEVRPLKDVASGGEISRIMLALKTILAKSERLPILVFDEIDVGISGSIARKVGQSMYDLAQYHQIISITHLPQIASLADTHFIVEKKVADGRTKTVVHRLSEDERMQEVASLISGADVTEAALENARQLIGTE